MSAFGVGRSTVREALNGLALLGVIEIRHGQGAYVAAKAPPEAARGEISRALSKGVTRDLLEARRGLELEIARLAAERRTATDLRNIEAVLARHERALRAGRPCARHSARFHMALAQAAHNEVLAGFVASFITMLEERGPSLESLEGYREWELDEHRGLYEAIRDGKPPLALRRMRAHLDAMVVYHGRLNSSA